MTINLDGTIRFSNTKYESRGGLNRGLHRFPGLEEFLSFPIRVLHIAIVKNRACLRGFFRAFCASHFDPRSQTLFGNDVVLAVTQPERARPGFPTLLFVPAAKQSFADKCSQTEFGNESKPTPSCDRSFSGALFPSVLSASPVAP